VEDDRSRSRVNVPSSGACGVAVLSVDWLASAVSSLSGEALAVTARNDVDAVVALLDGRGSGQGQEGQKGNKGAEHRDVSGDVCLGSRAK